MTRFAAAGIALGCAVIGLAGGHAIDLNIGSDQRDRFSDNQTELEALLSEQEDDNYSLARLRADTPEGCRVFVERYIPGGQMAMIDSGGNQQINDSAAVDDAMAHKDQPCGDDPSQVRETVLGIGRHVQSIQRRDARIQIKEQEVEEQRSVEVYGKQVAAGTLGVIGLIGGWMSSYDITKSIKTRRRESSIRR